MKKYPNPYTNPPRKWYKFYHLRYDELILKPYFIPLMTFLVFEYFFMLVISMVWITS